MNTIENSNGSESDVIKGTPCNDMSPYAVNSNDEEEPINISSSIHFIGYLTSSGRYGDWGVKINMANDRFETEGTVVDVIRGGKFMVKLDQNDAIIECTTSGKLKQNYIKILRGDRVTVDISPYDITKGRIVWREK